MVCLTGNMWPLYFQRGEEMAGIKVGDVITVKCERKTDFGKSDHYRIEPHKFKVLEVYEHHVLCQNIQNGIKESFTWQEIRKNMEKGETK